MIPSNNNKHSNIYSVYSSNLYVNNLNITSKFNFFNTKFNNNNNIDYNINSIVKSLQNNGLAIKNNIIKYQTGPTGGGLSFSRAGQKNVDISSDGNTAAIGRPDIIDNTRGVYIYIRNSSTGIWTQQGNILFGTPELSSDSQGFSVSLSADGNTLAVGASTYNNGTSVGAIFIFKRTGNIWSQEGTRLIGTDPGILGNNFGLGYSVSLSFDGNTLAAGRPSDDLNTGAVWIFIRTGSIWTQQGLKLIGTGYSGTAPGQGSSVSLSGDGNTLVIGSFKFNDPDTQGGFWIFTRSGSIWTQFNNIFTENSIMSFGYCVKISSSGETIVVGNYLSDIFLVYDKIDGDWVKNNNFLQGNQEIPINASENLSISQDGKTILCSGSGNSGGFFIFKKKDNIWYQLENMIVDADYPFSGFGTSCNISKDGKNIIIGGNIQDNITDSFWIYTID